MFVVVVVCNVLILACCVRVAGPTRATRAWLSFSVQAVLGLVHVHNSAGEREGEGIHHHVFVPYTWQRVAR